MPNLLRIISTPDNAPNIRDIKATILIDPASTLTPLSIFIEAPSDNIRADNDPAIISVSDTGSKLNSIIIPDSSPTTNAIVLSGALASWYPPINFIEAPNAISIAETAATPCNACLGFNKPNAATTIPIVPNTWAIPFIALAASLLSSLVAVMDLIESVISHISALIAATEAAMCTIFKSFIIFRACANDTSAIDMAAIESKTSFPNPFDAPLRERVTACIPFASANIPILARIRPL